MSLVRNRPDRSANMPAGWTDMSCRYVDGPPGRLIAEIVYQVGRSMDVVGRLTNDTPNRPPLRRSRWLPGVARVNVITLSSLMGRKGPLLCNALIAFTE